MRPRSAILAGALVAVGVLSIQALANDRLIKIDCNGGEVDDSAYADPTWIRGLIDQGRSDTSYGALSDQSRALGGGAGYARVVARPPQVVETVAGLRIALALAGGVGLPPQTIYIEDRADLDLSYCTSHPVASQCLRHKQAGPTAAEGCGGYTLMIPANVTLASGRGRFGSRGARLHSRTFSRCPLMHADNAANVRITGLRIHGPDDSISNSDRIHCEEAGGIRLESGDPLRSAIEIDNNELSAWPGTAVSVVGPLGVHVHHNVIQYNRRKEDHGPCGDYGLGYGVNVDKGSVLIESNVFDHNRHDIASDGSPGASYVAAYNLVLTGAVSHSFDVHGSQERAAGDPLKCTNIAGSTIFVHHNTFQQYGYPNVRIRAIPIRGAWVYRNETINRSASHAFDQINYKGGFLAEDNLTAKNRFPARYIKFDGTSYWQWQRFEGTPTTLLRAGDFDGDGAADVMASSPGGWVWWKGGREIARNLSSYNEPVSELRFGDFVGASKTDIVHALDGVWRVSDGGASPWSLLARIPLPLSSAAFGDFQADHHTDAFFVDGDRWVVRSFSPDSSVGYEPTRIHGRLPDLNELRFGNFVGDAKTDVLYADGKNWFVWNLGWPGWIHLNGSLPPLTRLSELTFADFNGDGLTDIARNKPNGNAWQVSWGGRSGWTPLTASRQNLKTLVVADFNGDRKADVLSIQSPDASATPSR